MIFALLQPQRLVRFWKSFAEHSLERLWYALLNQMV